MTYTPQPGSISHGAHRPQDLIPRFLEALRDTPEYAQLACPAYALEDEDSDWWDSEDCNNLLETLSNLLDSYAPPHHYFGAHPGEKANFGFWPV